MLMFARVYVNSRSPLSVANFANMLLYLHDSLWKLVQEEM